MSAVPAAMQNRLATLKAKVEPTLRDFEWTWTTAVVFSLGFLFLILITMVALPSFWMYFVGTKFHWSGPTDISDAAKEIFIQHKLLPDFLPDSFHPWGIQQTGLAVNNEFRDIVAMGLTTGPFITYLVVAAAMQNWRQKLRGKSGEKRPTGGYR